MGAITFSLDIKLVECIKKVLPVTVFFETGSFNGDTVHSMHAHFEQLITVELSESLWREVKRRFARERKIQPYLGNSPDIIAKFCPALKDSAVLYWLDAHWCVADKTSGSESQCPLLEEIEAIGQLNHKSIILIDDARLFLTLPPEPHDISHWPSIDSIINALRRISTLHEISVVNDVIIFSPKAISSAIKNYARMHGVDWLRASQSLVENTDLRIALEDKHSELQSTFTNNQQLSVQLVQKEAARQSSDTARLQAQAQLQGKETELNNLYLSVEQMKMQLDEKEAARQSSDTAHLQAQAQLQDKEAELKSLYLSVEQMKTQLDEKEAARQSSDAAHLQAQAQLQDKEAELKGLYLSDEQMKTQLDEKEALIGRLSTEFNNLSVQLATNQTELETTYSKTADFLRQCQEKEEAMQFQLAQKEAARQSTDAAHHQAQAQLQDKETELSALYLSIEQMKLQLNQKEDVIGRLSAEFNNLSAQLTAKQVELEKTYSSSADLLKQCQEKEDVIQGLITTYKILKILKDVRPYWKKYTQELRDIFKVRLGLLYQHPPIPLVLPKEYKNPGATKLPPLKISLVTPSFKQAAFIERTLVSVLDQQYPNLEYFIQDGASEDGTRELLQKYNDRLTGWESTPDGGQSHAINFGMQKTTGEIMAWLNSDDLLLPGSLAYVSDFFNRHPEIDVVYGHRMLIDENDQKIGRWMVPVHDHSVLSWADFVPQETLFWRRRIWEKTGGQIDESFRFAMDWDLIIRFRDAGARFARLPRFIGGFRIHPQQKTSAHIAGIGIQEMGRIRERNLGKLPSDAEIQVAIRSYLRKHLITDMGWRVKRYLKQN